MPMFNDFVKSQKVEHANILKTVIKWNSRAPIWTMFLPREIWTSRADLAWSRDLKTMISMKHDIENIYNNYIKLYRRRLRRHTAAPSFLVDRLGKALPVGPAILGDLCENAEARCLHIYVDFGSCLVDVA